MAWINQEKKQAIAKQLKLVVPKTWKWTLAINHHSTIVFNLAASDIDFLGLAQQRNDEYAKRRGEPTYPVGTHYELNPYWFREHYPADVVAILEPIFAALNDGNHDNSDLMTDYFDVGWYVRFNVGRWDKPYQYLAPVQHAA